MSESIVSPLVGMVSKLTNRSWISPEDRDRLLGLPSTARLFDAGSYLVREGDSPNHCNIIVSGLACGHKITGDGLRQIVAMHMVGDVVDLQLLYLEIADHNVQTLGRCEVVTVPRDALRRLLVEHPSIAHAVSTTILVDLSIASEWLLNIGRRDARKRIAHLLCELAARMDRADAAPGQDFILPMTQEQIGDAVGLTTVHTNRMIKSLIDDSLITFTKHAITIPNWSNLVRYADFNERYLHIP
jgi:CRP-like cAMP-binding protein